MAKPNSIPIVNYGFGINADSRKIDYNKKKDLQGLAGQTYEGLEKITGRDTFSGLKPADIGLGF
jgi:hypothetical protein